MDRSLSGRVAVEQVPGNWFANLPAELQRDLLGAADTLRFARGEAIARQGQHAASLNVVLEGQVRLLRTTPHGEALIYVAERGFWFGELACLGESRVMVNTVAATPATILQVEKAALDRLAAAHPRLLHELARLMARRASVILMAYGLVCSLSPEQRLLGQLALLTGMRREECPDEDPVDLPLSQVDLAAIVGVTRQTLHPLVKALVRQGLIDVRFGHIRVLDRVALGIQTGFLPEPAAPAPA